MAFFILVLFLILLLIGSIAGFYAQAKKLIAVGILVGLGIFMFLLVPNFMNIFSLLTGSFETWFTKMAGLLITYIILVGFIFGVHLRFALPLVFGTDNSVKKVISIISAIVIIPNILWSITILFRLIKVLGGGIALPEFYNTFIWGPLTFVILLIAYFKLGDEDDGLAAKPTNLRVAPITGLKSSSVLDRKSSKMKANIIMYGDDLKALDKKLLLKEIKFDEYMDIIVAIEMDNYEKQNSQQNAEPIIE